MGRRNASTGSTPTSKGQPDWAPSGQTGSRGPVRATQPEAGDMGAAMARVATQGSNADVGLCGPAGAMPCEGMTRDSQY